MSGHFRKTSRQVQHKGEPGQKVMNANKHLVNSKVIVFK